MSFRNRRSVVLSLAVLVLLGVLSSCTRAGGSDRAEAELTDNPTSAGEVRLGYFPNVTHAPALIAQHNGLFDKYLVDSKVVAQQFSNGPTAVNAFLGGSLDIGFLGPGPAINAYTKSKGAAVRMIAGATSGGAQLVTTPDISEPEDLAGKQIATPQLGGTQDVALKAWLAEHGLELGTGPTQVRVLNVDNAQTLNSFREGAIDGAWIPEPWSSRLIFEAGAKVFLDERDLWPGGTFPTTVVLVRKEFLEEHPTTVRAMLRGLVEATDWANENPDAAKQVTNDEFEELTGGRMGDRVLDRAFDTMELSVNPISAAFPRLARDSVTAEIVTEEPDLTGFADFRMLNQVLEQSNQQQIHSGPLAAR
ncbi:ABC transporter substrate-binding protein [Tamaricihabitans halophyticus]|uniref:ABC transporter substrate-binding protein n=1 Tax=Tamaricihabitans halophyticus TaxID=1262583 RepID=UPI003C76DEF4